MAFLTLYLTLHIGLRRLFRIFTMLNLGSLLIESAEVYGVILVFLVVFIVVWEKRRSLKDIASSIGLELVYPPPAKAVDQETKDLNLV